MRLFLTTMLIAFSTGLFAQNIIINGNKIGELELGMPQEVAEKIAGKKLTRPSEMNDYVGKTEVAINGEKFFVSINQGVEKVGEPKFYTVSEITTSSSKVKTKEHIGIGHTRDEVINAYKNFSTFSMYPGYDENFEVDPNTSIFNVEDAASEVTYSFKLVNDKVTEITVYNSSFSG